MTVRVRKARRNGMVACGHYVLVGNQIVRKPDGTWHCIRCVLDLARLMTEPPRPGRGGQDEPTERTPPP
jgi:hypothetical protein